MKKTVFTNGCFYIITSRHINFFKKIRDLFPPNEYTLIVGVNSVESQYMLKRYPKIFTDKDRKIILESIIYVDEVIIFNESTPIELIKNIRPDIIVKGIDYYKRDIIGVDYCNDGIVLIKCDDYYDNKSTQNIVNAIRTCGRGIINEN